VLVHSEIDVVIVWERMTVNCSEDGTSRSIRVLEERWKVVILARFVPSRTEGKPVEML